MNRRAVLLCVLMSLVSSAALDGQEAKSSAPRHLTLEEAVQLAMKHNHVIRIARSLVEEKTHTKGIARSAYFPTLRNDSNLLKLTDTQFIGIPAGSLGTVGGTAIPAQSTILNQGGLTIVTSGTGLTQPLTELWKIKAANDVAAAELSGTRNKERQTENDVVLKVHQLYYRVLVLQSHMAAAQARIQANESLQSERIEEVKYGSVLQEQVIESRAQALEAKQDLLNTELQLSDVTMQLDDAIGLPLKTQLALDTSVRTVGNTCEREKCLRIALESHPEIAEARARVEEASAAIRLAKRQYVPDVEAFARYSYQDNVPFLARNFGTFGVHFGYDLFDGGRRSAVIGEHKAQLVQAEENLARVKEDVELRLQTAYDKLARTQQMMKVSEELLALRTESHRVSVQQLQEGSALRSQVDAAVARELDARTLLLQSQLDYIQANDEMANAMGLTPE
jgi:outer membrane protein TolC